MPESSVLFYQNLKSFDQIQNILNETHYAALPADWYIIVSDVKGSTQAIQNGKYKDVNVVGVSSIIAARNACGDVQIPFIFGGDGATLFVPPEKIERVKQALSSTKKKARQEFNLDLRVGIIPVVDIYKEKQNILIAKMSLSATAAIAMAKGNGLTLAEALTKNTDLYELQEHAELENAHQGLECRWNPIQSKKGEILTAIIQARDGKMNSYAEILKEIYQVIPDFKLLDADQLSTAWPPQHLIKEMKMKHTGMKQHIYFNLVVLLVGILTIIVKKKRKEKGSVVEKYLQELSQNTDFVKFDETLRMVIDVSKNEKTELLRLLEKYKQGGSIYYGVHSSSEAMMTCFIQTNKDHVHFVDGGSGGYALAAKQLKAMKA